MKLNQDLRHKLAKEAENQKKLKLLMENIDKEASEHA